MANAETVEIIIEGTDNSVDAFVSANQSLTTLDRSSKKSIQAFETLGRMMGAGQFTGIVGDVFDTVNAFEKLNVVMKAGGVASIALKAGLAGIVGVAAFKLGEWIGEAGFETKKWADELKRVMSELERLGDESAKAFANVLSEDEKIIRFKFKGDPEAMNAELEDLRQRINTELGGQGKGGMIGNLDERKKTADEAKALANSLGGEGRLLAQQKFAQFHSKYNTEVHALIDAELKAIEIEEKKVLLLKEQSKQLDYQLNSEFAKMQADEAASQDRMKREQEYWQLVAEQEKAEAARQAESQKKSERLAEIWKQVADEADKFAQAQDDKDWDYIDKLKLQLEELTNGADAADKMAAAMAGIGDEALAAGDEIKKQINLVKEQARADEEARKAREDFQKDAEGIANKLLQDQAKAAPTLSAKESRFLTRGTAGGDPNALTAKNTAAIAAASKRAVELAKESRDLQNEIKQGVANSAQFVQVP